MLSLGLYHSSEIKSPQVALNSLESPKVAIFFCQFKSPKVALSYGALGPFQTPLHSCAEPN